MGWVTMQVVRVELEPYGGMARLVAVVMGASSAKQRGAAAGPVACGCRLVAGRACSTRRSAVAASGTR